MRRFRVLTRGVAGPVALTKALNELEVLDGEEFAIVRYHHGLLKMTEDEFVDALKREFDAEEID
jgi:hypothetical protein